MKNTPNAQPLTSKEYFALMRLLQTLENLGNTPGSEEHDWQTIYDKLNHAGATAGEHPKREWIVKSPNGFLKSVSPSPIDFTDDPTKAMRFSLETVKNCFEQWVWEKVNP